MKAIRWLTAQEKLVGNEPLRFLLILCLPATLDLREYVRIMALFMSKVRDGVSPSKLLLIALKGLRQERTLHQGNTELDRYHSFFLLISEYQKRTRTKLNFW